MAVDVTSWCSLTSGLVVAVVSLVAYRIWKAKQGFKVFEQQGIPGPAPNLISGNTGQMNKLGFCDSFIHYKKEYGNIVGLYFPNPSLAIYDLELLRDVMVKKFGSFHNRMPQPINDYKPWNLNLLALRDDHWKFVRSKMSPTFSSGKLKRMLPAIDQVIRNLDKHVKGKAESGEVVELKDLAGCFAMDTIAGAAFGIHVDSLSNPQDPFNVNGLKLFDQNTWIAILFMFPYMMPLMRKVGVTFIPMKPTNFFMEVMDIAFKDRRQDSQKHGDFLQLLVDSERETKGQVDAEIDFSAQLTTDKDFTRTGMTDDEMKSNAMLFFLAGFDTTSIVLSFTLYQMANQPDIIRKAQQEIDTKLGKKPVTYETASDLLYLDMCMMEAMRLNPPGWILDREADEDMQLGKYPVKKGTRILIPAYAIHRDPEHWTDPEKYDPERHTPEAKAARHPYAFMPFGHGPRNCIGMRLAQLEIRMALATLLQHYTPVLADNAVYPPVIKMPQLRMISKDGLPVKFKLRE